MKYISLILATVVFSSSAAFAAFDKDTPYQQAVPAFLKAITDVTESVKDDDELNEIAEWEEDARERLPEFLDDLLVISQRLEDEGTSEFIFEEYTAFVNKWNDIALTYPGLNELEPLISPLIDELFEGLPTLGPPSSRNPMSGLYDLYKAMEIEDPWGTGAFWVFEPLPDSEKVVTVQEIANETTIHGVEDKEIVYKETVATIDGVVVFFEVIEDDVTIQRYVKFRNPSFLHDTLEEMIENNEDPMVIAALTDLVAMIDFHLEKALNDGVLDECSYSFIYRKMNQGVLEGCTDIVGNTQNFEEMAKYDPFDDVNQVELSEPKELVKTLSDEIHLLGEKNSLQTPNTDHLLSEYQVGFIGTTQTFMVGVVVPAYVLSLVGFFRGF